MQIEIHIPKTVIVFVAVFGIVAGVAWYEGWQSGQAAVQGAAPVVHSYNRQQHESPAAPPSGGRETPSSLEIVQAEQGVQKARQQRALLENQEEILRYQLEELERELRRSPRDERLEESIRTSATRLRSLLHDKREAETYLLASLHELWDAQGRAGIVSDLGPGPRLRLSWPVEPTYGISASFMDSGYRQRFGLDHKAIDIPVEQGSTVRAPADGIVEKLVDNGYGYNYLILRHIGGVTLYGHLESFSVEEGQSVSRGDAIGLSGGRPGSLGAGGLSTGPHLHFEVIIDGEHVNPQEFLPSL